MGITERSIWSIGNVVCMVLKSCVKMSIHREKSELLQSCRDAPGGGGFNLSTRRKQRADAV